MWNSAQMNNRHPQQLKKIKILGALWELPAKQHCRFWPIRPNFEVNGLDWQCCLAGSSQRAPRIFIFSIVLGAENLAYVKSIQTHARAFLPLNISAISSVLQFTESLFFSFLSMKTLKNHPQKLKEKLKIFFQHSSFCTSCCRPKNTLLKSSRNFKRTVGDKK